MTRTIEVHSGAVTIVDDEDYEWLSKFRWCVSSKHGHLYACTYHMLDGSKCALLMHRLLLLPPAGLLVDHKDNDGLNNQRSNLRLCTYQQNNFNRVMNRSNKAGYKGVHSSGYRRWRALIKLDGRIIHLGSYGDRETAAKAYNEAALRLFGEFALLNDV